jgi:hypothetical protein
VSEIHPTLLVLAAGMGSRYGGLKQIEPIGPGGETLIDYSIYDAIRAGFGRVVFIIRKDIEAAFREVVGGRFERRVPVAYVFQELDDIPPGFSVPAERKKPWGTGHAVLVASGVVREPFAVINGDDFYGWESLAVLARHLKSGSPDFAMVGFKLRNTLSDFGSVARGICECDANGYLHSVTEVLGIARNGNGARSGGRIFSGDEVTSLNCWGFTPAVFGKLDPAFKRFLERQGRNPGAEFYLPEAVGEMIRAGEARVRVLTTGSRWLGITHRDDRQIVQAGIRELIAKGEYPGRLWD